MNALLASSGLRFGIYQYNKQRPIRQLIGIDYYRQCKEYLLADVKPFYCCRSQVDLACEVAALPYDVFNREEASAEISRNPRSFLRIDKSWAIVSDDIDEYDSRVYEKAAELFEIDLQDGVFIEEEEEHYFIYRLVKNGQSQIGIVSCIAVSDFENGVLKQHENTQTFKLDDRINHVNALRAHTGPIFVTYKAQEELDIITKQIVRTENPLYDFISDDNIRHTVWRVDDKAAEGIISNCFAELDSLYIVDGHHRASAAARIGIKEGGEAGYFLIIAFPANQLTILDYNRVVADTNGLTKDELFRRIAVSFFVEKKGADPVKPEQKGEFSLYLDREWYRLLINEGLRPNDPVSGLDVSLLHDLLLEPILGIDDPRTSERISFVGGARGLKELESQANAFQSDDSPLGGISFALFPCSLDELFTVADEGRLMPPKSTWFEPKPRSGLFIHRF